MEDPRISQWMADWIYDGNEESWKAAVRQVFGKCKSDGDDGGGSLKCIAMAVDAAMRVSEPVANKNRAATKEGWHVDENSFSSQVEANRVRCGYEGYHGKSSVPWKRGWHRSPRKPRSPSDRTPVAGRARVVPRPILSYSRLQARLAQRKKGWVGWEIQKNRNL